MKSSRRKICYHFRSYFNKISGDLDSALIKNAAVSKSKPAEVEDAKNLLMATQSCFRYTGLDYVYQVRACVNVSR
jgi:Arf-GAP/coiled-coil/ANK repeat/PH domain-containing protein